MALRSSFTKLAAPLSSLRFGAIWTGAAAALGLMVAWAPGCGGDNTAQPCPPSIGTGVCICDSLGCRPANKDTQTGSGGNGGSGAGGATTTGSSATGGAGTGGASACDPTQATCPCDNGKCPSGKACIDGLCVVGCNFSYECGAGKVCANGACVPGCDATNGCDAGYTCTNGACELDPANPQCSTAKPCPSGQVCSNGICTTQCTSNSQCTVGEVCDGGTHTCIPNPSPTPVCSTSKPCSASQVCLSDGFCHYPCTSLQNCKSIDNRFDYCDMGICKTDQEVNPQCTLSMPCPAGKSCISNVCK